MNNFNSVTSSVYSANNQKFLEEHKEAFSLHSDEWAGFKQWQQKGRKVTKGAKGCKVFMLCEKKIEKASGEDDKKTVLKGLYVFNFEHTEEV